jgi:hypothetical protein
VEVGVLVRRFCKTLLPGRGMRIGAAALLAAAMAAGLYAAHAAPGEVLGHRLHQHPADTPSGEFAQQMGGHEQHRISAHRAGRKGYRPGHVLRRREKHVSGGYAIDISDLAAAPPLEQHGRYPRLLLEFGVAVFLSARPADRIQFPENASAALRRQVTEIIQRDVDDTT